MIYLAGAILIVGLAYVWRGKPLIVIENQNQYDLKNSGTQWNTLNDDRKVSEMSERLAEGRVRLLSKEIDELKKSKLEKALV